MISGKSLSFPEISRAQIPPKITKNNSQGIIFVIISCQRVLFLVEARGLGGAGLGRGSGRDSSHRKKIRDGETTKIKFAFLRGGGERGQRRKSSKCCFFFRGKRHDNKILKVQNLLSRNFVVIAQAPIRESETTIKIKFALFRGGGGQGGREENCPKRFFFMGNVMTKI